MNLAEQGHEVTFVMNQRDNQLYDLLKTKGVNAIYEPLLPTAKAIANEKRVEHQRANPTFFNTFV